MDKLILLLITIGFFSCSELNKEPEFNYQYIEIIEEENTFRSGTTIKEEEPDTIIAKNDSIAYLEAYGSFINSTHSKELIEKQYGRKSTSTPIKFKLIKEGVDIANTVTFMNKIEKENEIRKNSTQAVNEILRENNIPITGIIDNATIKKLSVYFEAEENEFSAMGTVWHKPKSAPKYANRNALYCYFQSNDGVANNLRFKMQYHADDWLFIRKVQFSIDGNAYDFYPSDVNRDSGNGGKIWEWFDEVIGSKDKSLIETLANAQTVKMKLIGDQYHKVKTVSGTQIRDMKRTLELYKAMGGRFY